MSTIAPDMPPPQRIAQVETDRGGFATDIDPIMDHSVAGFGALQARPPFGNADRLAFAPAVTVPRSTSLRMISPTG